MTFAVAKPDGELLEREAFDRAAATAAIPRCPSCKRLVGSREHVCPNDAPRVCRYCGEPLRDSGFDVKGRTCVRCGSARGRARRRLERLRLIAEFGGRCQRCGYSRSTVALHFHHVDPSEKHARGAARGRRLKDTSLREVRDHRERFELLCANCHAEEHHA